METCRFQRNQHTMKQILSKYFLEGNPIFRRQADPRGRYQLRVRGKTLACPVPLIALMPKQNSYPHLCNSQRYICHLDSNAVSGTSSLGLRQLCRHTFVDRLLR